MQKPALVSFILLTLSFPATAQKVLKGKIKDSHSDETIPFASVQFQNSTIGTASDSAGNFSFHIDQWPSDTLEISYVGYEVYKLYIDPKQDQLEITIPLERGRMKKEVVIKSKHTRGWFLWRRVVKNKPKNNRTNFDNFSYELYNRLELDIRNFNKKTLRTFKLPKEMDFVLKYIDSSTEETPFLPVFFTETISDYYHSENPNTRSREVIKATQNTGVENQSVSKFFGGMYQNVNVYKNFIDVFDKKFVSPISDNGDQYYDYRLADTQYVAGKRFLHLVFAPKHQGENTFDGDCWIHDTSYAVQKMNLRLAKEANINHVEKLSLIQEYKQLNDSSWVLYKDKFVVDLSPFNLNKMLFTGRKTTTYKDVLINNDSVTRELKKNKLQEEIVMLDDATKKDPDYWKQSRHDTLEKNEVRVYKMVDTLLSLPKFRNYTEWINFIATGYRNVGNFQIGPWGYWITGNYWEGTRLRFDLGTNHHFNKHLQLSAYLAYGFKDEAFKYGGEMLYLFKKHPRQSFFFSYRKDFDNGQHYYDDEGSGNTLEALVRRNNIPMKFMMKEEFKTYYFTELPKGFSVRFNASRQRYDPLRFLPVKSLYDSVSSGEALNNFDVGITLRFAYLENFVENYFHRSSLGSPYPIVELRYNKGISGLLNSSYDYSKLFMSVSDYMNIPPYGSLYYNFFGGKIWGTLPFPLLEIHPGNESYFYNKYSFNMMNRFEFVSDRYAGFNIEHNIGNGIFRLTKLTRKLKMRQFWNAKAVWGNLSDANKKLNFTGTQSFQSLNGKPYLEIGTGVENIFRFFRVDLVWRVTPRVTQALPGQSDRNFGVFGSFKVGF